MITEFQLGAGAKLKSIEAAEAVKRASLQGGAAQQKPIKLPGRGGKARPEPVVPRQMFPQSFGKQRRQDDDASKTKKRKPF